MEIIDFIYDNVKLSEMGLGFAYFNGSEDSVEVGNELTLNTIKSATSNESVKINHEYSDNLSMTFQISRYDDCQNEEYDYHIFSDEEINKVVRWLNRKDYHKFVPVYANSEFDNVYFNATFNVSLVKFGFDVVGFELTMNTNAPYGFMESSVYELTFNSTSDALVIEDNSDEEGYRYAQATITCLEDGDLEIGNWRDPYNVVKIANCKKSEVITLDGVHKIISSTGVAHTTIAKDFNYKFIRLYNDYYNSTNKFKSSMKIKLSITYSPVRKVGIIL